MKKTYRNGDVVVRIRNIAAVCIEEDEPKNVKIYVNMVCYTIRCKSAKEAECVLDDLQKIIEDYPE